MSAHLSDDTLLDLAETGASHPHLATCERCRRALEDTREALTLARADAMPEPSPLFWERFSARVRTDVRADAGLRPPRLAWLRAPAWRPIAALAFVVLVAVVAGVGWQLRHGREALAPALATVAVRTADAPANGHPTDGQPIADLVAPPADPSWTVIEQVTAHLGAGSAEEAGLVLQADASEHALLQLSPVEQQELVRLLQADPDGPSH